MNTRTATPATGSQSNPSVYRPTGASGILRALWEKVDFSALSDEELKALDCTEQITCELGNIAKTMAGIGCLIASDYRDNKSGALQTTDEIAIMLWGFSDMIATNAEAIDVASEAGFYLRERAGRRR
jgi:hypothetical protein